MTLTPDRQALYDELHDSHAAVQAAREAYTEAANRRRAAAKALDIGPTALAAVLGLESVSSAHAILRAAVDGKLPATVHKRKTRKPKAAVPAEAPVLNVVTGVESGTPQVEPVALYPTLEDIDLIDLEPRTVRVS